MNLTETNLLKKIHKFDFIRDVAIFETREETITFCVDYFIYLAKKSINDHDNFFVALSGGSTPKAIFEKLTSPLYFEKVEWSKVHLFWSDERSVLPTDVESNYKMAMDAGFANLPIPYNQIYRMKAEDNIEEEAKKYEMLIIEKVPHQEFDMVMLGIGEDGHTASLFPNTLGLQSENRQVIANYIPRLETWRMSLTFNCINQSKNIVVYAIGKEKAGILRNVFYGKHEPEVLPAQLIGTHSHKSLWIMDQAAGEFISPSSN